MPVNKHNGSFESVRGLPLGTAEQHWAVSKVRALKRLARLFKFLIMSCEQQCDRDGKERRGLLKERRNNFRAQ